MKIKLLVLLIVPVFGASFVNGAFPIKITDDISPPYLHCPSDDVDMKYHYNPSYYWTLSGSDWTLAGYFEPYKFNVYYNFRIKRIGFVGYFSNGSAAIYIFLAETGGHPDCTPPDFSNKKFGPKYWHINKSYPFYDDCNLYSSNWYIKRSEIDAQPNKRFWILYYLSTSPPPYPVSDNAKDNKNSLTWDPTRQDWVPDISGYKPCWCMHVVIEYPPTTIDNTSIGTIKTIFK